MNYQFPKNYGVVMVSLWCPIPSTIGTHLNFDREFDQLTASVEGIEALLNTTEIKP